MQTVFLRERTPGALPGLSSASLYRCLRLQVCSLALASSNSHGGCGADCAHRVRADAWHKLLPI
jgi:hypothetical protein